MSTGHIHLISPAPVREFLRSGSLSEALEGFSRLAGVTLTVEGLCGEDWSRAEALGPFEELPIRYRGRTLGRLLYRTNGNIPSVVGVAGAMTSLLEHMTGREEAVSGLAEAMITTYEELNMLYNLLPNMATSIRPAEIGEVLVDETARILSCGRVSLLALDAEQKNLQVLASRGLPSEIGALSIPVSGSISEYALFEEDLLVVSDISRRPELARRSSGRYECASFAVVRVPLRARGEAIGVLTVTERNESGEFTSRDRKLLEGLSAMGASALLNCRLHASIHKQMMSTIQALASTVDAKDHYTHDHSGRVAQLCLATARRLGIEDPATCREIELAGLLHDIGKIGIPDAILSKTDRLTADEYEIIKTHVKIGAGIVEHIQGLEGVAKAILHHHERYDGMGFPSGLGGDDIPLASRLISIVDTYDCITSDRPYREATGTEEALRELIRCKETQFDAELVDAFISTIHEEPGPGGAEKESTAAK